MILADRDILSLLTAGTLGITPAPDLALQLQPASLDLRLGPIFMRPRGNLNPDPIHPAQKSHFRVFEPVDVPAGGSFCLECFGFCLATTIEEISLPAGLVAHLEGRSSLGRLGLLIHSTAGLIDPGFQGHLTLELSNLGPAPLLLIPGMRICQVTFEMLSSPAMTPYDQRPGAKYQHQGPATPSRLYADPEIHTLI